jgi:hypothetical protein
VSRNETEFARLLSLGPEKSRNQKSKFILLYPRVGDKGIELVLEVTTYRKEKGSCRKLWVGRMALFDYAWG